MEPLGFMTDQQVREVRERFGTPIYVYDRETLRQQARAVLELPHAFGYQPRYAMKACPTAEVVRTITNEGIHIDASSAYEVQRAMKLGIPATQIMLTAQELSTELESLLAYGVRFNACSLRQLATYGELRPGTEVSVRVNAGLGSGHSNRTNVGGPSSSFGIWHEQMGQILEVARAHDLTISAMHTHIGSGTDPDAWNHVAQMTLAQVKHLPDAKVVSLGGGFKVGRMPGETSADLHAIGELIKRDFEGFARETGRELDLEIEPGTYYVANACAIVSEVNDIVSTGEQGYRFLKLDAGMTEVLRPSLYGAQHPLTLVTGEEREAAAESEYLVVGHCCESGDILTPAPGDPEALAPRTFPEVQVGDLIVIGGAGAYCASMASKNYNSFPEAAEVMLDEDGSLTLIRRRQTLEQILENEI